ncbi:MAG TPA: hypothetical protein VGC63_09540 [Solirubrobacterales bacterium]|jgi:hypothetical protein
MSLDGLRAWIGIVERKLAMRTRVFLVLVAIAIGGAAAGIYLGIDAQNDQISESDAQALQRELTARIETLETRLEGLEGSEVPAPPPAPEAGEKGNGATKP